MSQVYTFCKSGGANTSGTNPTNTSGTNPTNTSGTNPTTGLHLGASGLRSVGNTQGTYNFKQDGTKPLTFTEEEFPSLGGSKVSTSTSSKNIGSWASNSAAVREPFTEKVVMKKNIPPLFRKVQKTKKTEYYDEDEEEDDDDNDDNDDKLYYEYESDSGEVVRSTSYGDYYEDEEDE